MIFNGFFVLNVLLAQILVWLILKKKQIVCVNLNLILSLLKEVISVGLF